MPWSDFDRLWALRVRGNWIWGFRFALWSRDAGRRTTAAKDRSINGDRRTMERRRRGAARYRGTRSLADAVFLEKKTQLKFKSRRQHMLHKTGHTSYVCVYVVGRLCERLLTRVVRQHLYVLHTRIVRVVSWHRFHFVLRLYKEYTSSDFQSGLKHKGIFQCSDGSDDANRKVSRKEIGWNKQCVMDNLLSIST